MSDPMQAMFQIKTERPVVEERKGWFGGIITFICVALFFAHPIGFLLMAAAVCVICGVAMIPVILWREIVASFDTPEYRGEAMKWRIRRERMKDWWLRTIGEDYDDRY